MGFSSLLIECDGLRVHLLICGVYNSMVASILSDSAHLVGLLLLGPPFACFSGSISHFCVEITSVYLFGWVFNPVPIVYSHIQGFEQSL